MSSLHKSLSALPRKPLSLAVKKGCYWQFMFHLIFSLCHVSVFFSGVLFLLVAGARLRQWLSLPVLRLLVCCVPLSSGSASGLGTFGPPLAVGAVVSGHSHGHKPMFNTPMLISSFSMCKTCAYAPYTCTNEL